MRHDGYIDLAQRRPINMASILAAYLASFKLQS